MAKPKAKKSNFIIFRPRQNRKHDLAFNISNYSIDRGKEINCNFE